MYLLAGLVAIFCGVWIAGFAMLMREVRKAMSFEDQAYDLKHSIWGDQTVTLDRSAEKVPDQHSTL